MRTGYSMLSGLGWQKDWSYSLLLVMLWDLESLADLSETKMGC